MERMMSETHFGKYGVLEYEEHLSYYHIRTGLDLSYSKEYGKYILEVSNESYQATEDDIEQILNKLKELNKGLNDAKSN